MVEDAKVLSIGSIEGGLNASNRPWRNAVSRLMQSIANARGNISSPLNLNVVFQIPGHLLRPDFEGVRTGTFSKKRNLLMVQVALPEEVPSDVWTDLLYRMEAAIDEAERWAQGRKVADNLDALRSIVERAYATRDQTPGSPER